MSVHQPRALKRPIFALVSLLALAALFGVEMNAARHTTLGNHCRVCDGAGYLGLVGTELLDGVHHRTDKTARSSLNEHCRSVSTMR